MGMQRMLRINKLIEENKAVKDLGVLTGRDVSFSDHIYDLVLLSKIKAGLLLRAFKTKEAEPILMFNSFICNEFDYCFIILNPDKKGKNYKIERIQRNFTSKIKGLEGKTLS